MSQQHLARLEGPILGREPEDSVCGPVAATEVRNPSGPKGCSRRYGPASTVNTFIRGREGLHENGAEKVGSLANTLDHRSAICILEYLVASDHRCGSPEFRVKSHSQQPFGPDR